MTYDKVDYYFLPSRKPFIKVSLIDLPPGNYMISMKYGGTGIQGYEYKRWISDFTIPKPPG